MGLYMCLKSRNAEFAAAASGILEKMGPDGEYVASISKATGTVMCWYDANAVHGWFAKRAKSMLDYFAPYPVTVGQLEELRSTCDEVIASSRLVDAGTCRVLVERPWGQEVAEAPYRVIEDDAAARRLLPTKEWECFGSAKYDYRYLRSIERTSEMLGAIIHVAREFEARGESPKLEYRAIW